MLLRALEDGVLKFLHESRENGRVFLLSRGSTATTNLGHPASKPRTTDRLRTNRPPQKAAATKPLHWPLAAFFHESPVTAFWVGVGERP